jgi:hypothetical protein
MDRGDSDNEERMSLSSSSSLSETIEKHHSRSCILSKDIDDRSFSASPDLALGLTKVCVFVLLN